ncbi:Sin-like protein conserved region-domain-containing protein [Zopfochytrium polystomum]|nr:Sin-like protein conserved region-domain-containing protein [Zopfochytrium polystomum]
MDVDDDDDVDGADDPLVAEIPIYLSQQLAQSLFLFQYPTRKQPPQMPLGARIKPLGHRFELELPIPGPDTGHHDEEQAEKMAVGLDDRRILTAFDVDVKSERGTWGSGAASNGGSGGGGSGKKVLDRQVFQSSVVPANGTYFIAAVRDEELHMTPLTSTVQLRPAFRYLDKIHEKERAANQRIQLEEALAEGIAPVEEEAKLLQLSVRSADDKDAKKRASAAEELRRYEREEWSPLAYYGAHSAETEDEYDKLFSIGDEIKFITTKKEYLDEIGPKVQSGVGGIYFIRALVGGKIKISVGTPLDSLRALPLLYQVKCVMLNANVIQFSSIQELIGPMFSEAEILEELKSVAVLVRGVWILRSEVTYSGRIAEARRLLLHLFSQKTNVRRRDVNAIANLPHAVVTNLFVEIATRVPPSNKEEPSSWVLKVPADEDFCARHPDVVAKQRDVVEAEAKRSTITPSSSSSTSSTSTTPSKTSLPPSSSSSSSSAGSSSKKKYDYSVTGSTAQGQCESLVRQILLTHGVASSAYMVKVAASRSADSTAENNLMVDTTEEEVMAVINDLCVRVFDRYALKVINNSSVDEVQDAALFCFRCLELFQTKTTVKKADVNNACKEALGKQPPQNVYAKIMKELAISSGPSWVSLKRSFLSICLLGFVAELV